LKGVAPEITGAAPGETVRVLGVEGLKLRVERRT